MDDTENIKCLKLFCCCLAECFNVTRYLITLKLKKKKVLGEYSKGKERIDCWIILGKSEVLRSRKKRKLAADLSRN